MNIAGKLFGVALRYGIKAAGIEGAEKGAEAIAAFLQRRLNDPSERLPRALGRAHERAWKALEVALAGDSLWDRARLLLVPAEEKAFRREVHTFLDACPLPGPAGKPELRAVCLRELRAAQKAGTWAAGKVTAHELTQETAAFVRYQDAPAALLDAEWQTLRDVADLLHAAGYPALADLVAARPAGGDSLLVLAVRYFFRREVTADEELVREFAFRRLETLSQAQEAGFAGLSEALTRHGQQLEEMLEGLLGIAVETRDAVLDLKDDMRQLLQQFHLQDRALRASDSLSIHGEVEKKLVKELLRRHRALPPERQGDPALLEGLGKLEIAIGDFEGAQRNFLQAAALATEPSQRAEAHYHAGHAALERRDLTAALAELLQAAQLDASRFAPFPMEKYEAERILGAGGFGVAFLCRDRHTSGRVVIKTLRAEGLDRDVGAVFGEAHALEALEHPAIIRLKHCDYADGARTRPYLVMEYFEGLTLAEYVHQHGPLSSDDLLAVARQVAAALQAAHTCGILHRDVKPANILVRQVGRDWRVKLIDFGLALRRQAVQNTLSNADALGKTMIGGSVAGTLEYAAPEQLGRAPGADVGPHSDVYGFGKTCLYAHLGTPDPDDDEKATLPEAWRKLLGQCTARTVEKRLRDAQSVLTALSAFKGPGETLPARERHPPATMVAVPEPEAVPSPRAGAVQVPHAPDSRPARTPPRLSVTSAGGFVASLVGAVLGALFGLLLGLAMGQPIFAFWGGLGGLFVGPFVWGIVIGVNETRRKTNRSTTAPHAKAGSWAKIVVWSMLVVLVVVSLFAWLVLS